MCPAKLLNFRSGRSWCEKHANLAQRRQQQTWPKWSLTFWSACLELATSAARCHPHTKRGGGHVEKESCVSTRSPVIWAKLSSFCFVICVGDEETILKLIHTIQRYFALLSEKYTNEAYQIDILCVAYAENLLTTNNSTTEFARLTFWGGSKCPNRLYPSLLVFRIMPCFLNLHAKIPGQITLIFSLHFARKKATTYLQNTVAYLLPVTHLFLLRRPHHFISMSNASERTDFRISVTSGWWWIRWKTELKWCSALGACFEVKCSI